ncbi:hypothetical protein WN943_007540 [Citrus x changshan-huyou]
MSWMLRINLVQHFTYNFVLVKLFYHIRVCAASLIRANSRSDGCSMPVEEDFRDSEVRQTTTAPGMTKIKSVSQLDKAVAISSRPSGYVEKLKIDGSCRNNHGNNDKGKDWSDAAKGEGVSTNCESKQLYNSAASGSMYQNNEIEEKEVCEDAQHMDLIDVADFVIKTQTSPPCSESLHSNIRIEVIYN